MDGHVLPHSKATARGGPRRADDAPLRPLTSMGSVDLRFDSTQATAPPSGHAVAREFDVRQFLLDQKGESLHKGVLFRSPTALQGVDAGHNNSSSTARLQSPQPATSLGPAFREPKTRKALLPRMELAQSTGSLPRSSSTGTFPTTCTHRLRQTPEPNNKPEGDDGGAISHFYTLERMAESCYHAVQSRNKTWLFLPGSEERSKGNAGGGGLGGVQRPSRRADLLDLQRCYEAALQFATRKHDRDVECSDRLAMVDRDVVAIQTRVADKYAVSAACPDAEEAVAADHKALVRLFFEQKWADVVLGELEAMLTVSFLEQGVALRKARIQYAQAFFRLEKLHAAQWGRLNEALDDLERLRADIRRTDDVHEQNARELKATYEAEIQQLTAGFEASKGDLEQRVVESKDQVAKMGDTMKTLNAIFRQMREDTEKVKAVELRESYAKLEQKYEQSCEQVARLRPLVELNQQLSAQVDALTLEREKFRDDMAQLDVLLGTKDETISRLMEQQSDLLAAQELREAKEEEMRKRAAEDEEDEEDEAAAGPETSTDDTDRVVGIQDGGPRSDLRKTGRRNSSVVCVRCKQELRAMSARGGVTENSTRTLAVNGEDASRGDGSADTSSSGSSQLQIRRKRIQCLNFRILLPNLRGRRPQREPAWTFSCMRAILFAKQVDDTMCRRSGGAFPSRIRMPEFVYAWFSPWRPIRDEKLEAEYGVNAVETPAIKTSGDSSEPGEGDLESEDDGHVLRSALSAEQRQMLADEERWCLYYGVKALVQQGYLEAKLFLSLLDEKFGEDELVFMLYCYQLLDVLVGGRLSWGPLRDKVAYHSFAREFDHLFGSPSSSPTSVSTKPRSIVPKTIWVSPYHASLATSIVLARATEAERDALDKKMMEYVVTNVPDDERPAVFLTPEQMGVATGPFARKKPRRRHVTHETTATASGDADSDEESEPQQFIDAHLWVELMMLEYKEEQAHRRAAIRLMFQTATSSVTNGDMSSLSTGGITSTVNTGATMDMEQFRVMVRTLNDETPAFVVATLFRNAYARGHGVVTFDAFMDAAEANQFFSTCMRLESPAACLARLASGLHKSLAHSSSPMLTAVSASSRAAFLVEKLFTILRLELSAVVAALPLWTRSVTDALVFEISSVLLGSDGAGGNAAHSDGMRLLSSFHRLVEYLQLVKLVKREVTGEAVSSKHIFGIEKALQALVDSVRLRDKSTVELLMDTVKQKLCVKRVQLAFRQHLQREFGAPLAMRTLMHRDYGRVLCGSRSLASPTPYRSRNSIRPLPWLLAIISQVFRASLTSHRVPTLLVELSSVSSAVTSSTAQHTLDSLSRCLASVNGGIGPAPRSVLLELVYDFFVDKFGTRWEAEKLLHDVFVTCRAAISRSLGDEAAEAGGHPLAWLFGYVCCMDALPPLPGSDSTGEGDDGANDRLLGQNEAVAFVQAILRCGLHRFALLDPNFEPVRDQSPDTEHSSGSESDSAGGTLPAWSRVTESWRWPSDWMSVDAADKILAIAFVKRSADQTQRMRSRLLAEAATAHASGDVVDAGAFLVLALHEWRRYVLHRMEELREVCRALDGDELAQFDRVLPLETVAVVLQKANVVFSADELSIVFRRLLATESPAVTSAAKKSPIGRPASYNPSTPPLAAVKERLCQRVAAASFPLLAREPLAGLVEMEDAAAESFKVAANARLSLDLLVRSWRVYEQPSRALMDQLRHVGKSNDIQTEAFSRAGTSPSTSQPRQVLYLSSSTAGSLSSQDVAQLEAAHALFLERLATAASAVDVAERERERELDKDAEGQSGEAAAGPGNNGRVAALSSGRFGSGSVRLRRSSVAVNKHNGSLQLLDDEETRENTVKEAWKGLRQLLVGLAKLRALAGIGTGALPDALDGAADGSTASA